MRGPSTTSRSMTAVMSGDRNAFLTYGVCPRRSTVWKLKKKAIIMKWSNSLTGRRKIRIEKENK